jgi:hypothetical protein
LLHHKDQMNLLLMVIALGEGAGPETLMMQSQFANRRLSDILAEMIPYDTTGEIQYLYQNALARGQ